MQLLGLATELMPGVAAQLFSSFTNGLLSEQHRLELSDNWPVVADFALYFGREHGGEKMEINGVLEYEM